MTNKMWYLQKNKKRYYFTPEQKSQYQELVGKAVYDYVNEYYNDNLGEGLTAEEQVLDIYEEIDRIGKDYRNQMLDEMIVE